MDFFQRQPSQELGGSQGKGYIERASCFYIDAGRGASKRMSHEDAKQSAGLASLEWRGQSTDQMQIGVQSGETNDKRLIVDRGEREKVQSEGWSTSWENLLTTPRLKIIFTFQDWTGLVYEGLEA